MGMRLHVVKKQAKYGDTEAFNWSYEEFYNLMCLFSDEVCGEPFDRMWEMPVSDFKKAIKFIEKAEKTNDRKKLETLFEDNNIDEEDFNALMSVLQVRSGEVVSNMKAFYKERDKQSSWIQFVTF